MFGCYLGLRVRLAQSLSLALTIPAVAAVFSCGLAPIHGFLRLTLQADPLVARGLRHALLLLCLLTGVGQLWRCGYAVHTRTRALGAAPVASLVKLVLLLAGRRVPLRVLADGLDLASQWLGSARCARWLAERSMAQRSARRTATSTLRATS